MTLLTILASALVACREITQPIDSPVAARSSFLTSPGGNVVVSPGDMHGWAFYDDQAGTACTDEVVCTLVDGPTGAPSGTGSAELATPAAANGKTLVLVDYVGVRLDRVTDLRYSTYRQSPNPGANLAIALQFNADYDLGGASAGYQGRLVFEPYQGHGGNVPDTTWQSWDAKAGKWWGTRASVPRGGVLVANPCVQATPCTWAQLLAAFPNAGVHATYGAVYLKAGSGWPGFRGNVDNLVIGVDGATTTFNFERTVATVPPLPPTGVPDWIYADSNFISGGTTIAGDLAKSVVMVAFDAGTPSSTRGAAVGLVNGIVVGGIPIDDDGEGVYYIRVATAGTPDAILNARRTLAAAPGVAMAIPIINDVIGSDYRRPIDGVKARQWQIDTAKADGDNWALESIAAPMAWGCSTGDPSTRVAVIDQDFHRIDDLIPTRHEYYVPDTVTGRHGTAVASILAAHGNNDIGSTGVMWRSDLRLWDHSRPISDTSTTGLPDSVVKKLSKDGMLKIVLRMRKAVLDDARVINVSANIGLPAPVPEGSIPIPDDSSGHRFVEERVRPAMRWVLSLRNGQPNAPLFVFSAGNGGIDRVGRDASLNGYPVAAKDFPSRVLVVAGTFADGFHDQILGFVNMGPLVHIAAPGQRVMALDQNGNVASLDGTSAATPLVAGVAGLLISFDPSLTVNEVRDFVLAGALLGGQNSVQSGKTQSLPYLNAYESLKLAARRQGAPLCGNRVYKSGNSIIALRGTTEDLLVQLDTSKTDSNYAEINVFHGGKRMDLGLRHAFEWQPGTRKFVEKLPYRFPQDLPAGGTYRSSTGRDHDNYSGLGIIQARYSSGSPIDSSVIKLQRDTVGWEAGEWLVTEARVSRPTTEVVVGWTPGSVDDHWNGDFNPNNKTYAGTWAEARTGGLDAVAFAMAPSGDYALVAVNFITRTNAPSSSVVNCTEPAYPDYPPHRCAIGSVSAVSAGTTVYQVNLREVTVPRVIKELAGVEIEWLALNEQEDEIIWQRVVRQESSTFLYLSVTTMGPGPWYDGNIGATLSVQPKTCTGRTLEYHVFDKRASAINPVGAARSPFPKPLLDGCRAPQANLAGTMSPSRTPTSRRNP